MLIVGRIPPPKNTYWQSAFLSDDHYLFAGTLMYMAHFILYQFNQVFLFVYLLFFLFLVVLGFFFFTFLFNVLFCFLGEGIRVLILLAPWLTQRRF